MWGYYQFVEIQAESGAKRVLLIEADAHLAHPPWINGGESMVKAVAGDAKPAQIYSIGTSGGASVNQRLGDVAITNGGTLQLKEPENVPSGLSGKTFTSNWFPDLSLIPKVQPLFFPMSSRCAGPPSRCERLRRLRRKAGSFPRPPPSGMTSREASLFTALSSAGHNQRPVLFTGQGATPESIFAKNFRMSTIKRSGCSRAAKCPPFGMRVFCTMLYV